MHWLMVAGPPQGEVLHQQEGARRSSAPRQFLQRLVPAKVGRGIASIVMTYIDDSRRRAADNMRGHRPPAWRSSRWRHPAPPLTHRRRRTTSSDQNGLRHLMHRCHPTRLTTRGGVTSWSSTDSRRRHPSYDQGHGSTKPWWSTRTVGAVRAAGAGVVTGSAWSATDTPFAARQLASQVGTDSVTAKGPTLGRSATGA